MTDRTCHHLFIVNSDNNWHKNQVLYVCHNYPVGNPEGLHIILCNPLFKINSYPTQDEKLNFLVQCSYSSAEVTYTVQVEYHVSWTMEIGKSNISYVYTFLQMS